MLPHVLDPGDSVMRALRFHAQQDLRIEDVPQPAAVGANQLVVKPSVCGICGTDLHEYAAGPLIVPTAPHVFTGAKLPQILGHEFAGEVIEVGADVRREQVTSRA